MSEPSLEEVLAEAERKFAAITAKRSKKAAAAWSDEPAANEVAPTKKPPSKSR